MIYKSEADVLCEKATKKLHGELLAEGIRNRDVAAWLNCSEQNISQLWRKCSFSYKQILVINHELEKMRKKNDIRDLF